jgi:hypothetical protein
MAKDTRWDRNLTVALDAEGLIGHAGAVLLRKLADQCGLTSALGAALGRAGKFPLIDRGIALVSMAVAIALGGEEHERHHRAGTPGAGLRRCAQ